ncbi:hypothetical protein PAXINDRAFT_91705, partial [Paxillus involutus ATCC 200175]
RPLNWASNTTIAMIGILAIAYGVWNVSAEREVTARFILFFVSRVDQGKVTRAGTLYWNVSCFPVNVASIECGAVSISQIPRAEQRASQG